MASNHRLKQERELRGWSQAKVAEQLGTDATTVSRWERGLFLPTPYFRERLCVLFGKNAEELGLLGNASRPRESEYDDGMGHRSIGRSLPYGDEEGRREEARVDVIEPPVAPSWPKRTDTFTYILHSAMHDQQAHMLWENAYVRALHGQRTEAQQLGEASLKAFERVGHFNAVAIREWLDQRELASPPDVPPPAPPTTLPVRADQRKFPTRQMIRRRGTGIALALLIISTFFLAGFTFKQLYPTASALPPVAHLASAAKSIGQESPPARPSASAGTTTSTLTNATATSTAGQPEQLRAAADPSSLTPQICHLEPLGYRCDVRLWLYTTDANAPGWSWMVDHATLPVRFSSASGSGQAGQPCQLTVYIQSVAGQRGQISFTFRTASGRTTVLVNWAG